MEHLDLHLCEREIMFLVKSNAMEQIYQFDYELEAEQRSGHDLAWILLRDKARAGKILLLADMKRAHQLIMDEQAILGKEFVVDPALRGVFRGCGNRCEVVSRGYYPPSHAQVPLLMDQFQVQFEERLASDMDPVENAALTHYQVERIHPFRDGNSRMARMYANVSLVYEGLPILLFTSEEDYYRSIATIDGAKKYFRELAKRQF